MDASKQDALHTMHYGHSIWDDRGIAKGNNLPPSLVSICCPVLNFTLWSSSETPAPDSDGAPLDDVVRDEREYVHKRLREELQREPTEAEVDEWLRQHTEGY